MMESYKNTRRACRWLARCNSCKSRGGLDAQSLESSTQMITKIAERFLGFLEKFAQGKFDRLYHEVFSRIWVSMDAQTASYVAKGSRNKKITNRYPGPCDIISHSGYLRSINRLLKNQKVLVLIEYFNICTSFDRKKQLNINLNINIFNFMFIYIYILQMHTEARGFRLKVLDFLICIPSH